MAQIDRSPVGNPTPAAPGGPDGGAPAPGRRSRDLIRRGAALLAACSAAVALLIACVGGDRELFQDESYVIWLDRSGWGHIHDLIRFEPSPPLYHYAVKLWIDLGGESEAWFRGLSGLCYLAAFPVIWWLGGPTFSRSERLALVVLLIAARSLGFNAIYGRFNELMFLDSCVIFLSFVGLFGGTLPRAAALSLLAVSNFAGLMTHYYFAFALLAQGVAYLLFYRWRRLGDFLIGGLGPVVAFAVAWGPTFRDQMASGRFNGDRTPPPFSVLLEDTYFARRWFLILPALLLLAAVARRRGRWRLASAGQVGARAARLLADPRARVFAVLWAVSFSGPFLASFRLGDQFLKVVPYIMMTTMPLAAVLALAVDRSERLLRIAAGLVIVAAVGLAEARSRAAILRRPFPEGGCRESVEKMLRAGKSGDVVVCLDNYLTKVDYYLRNSRAGVRMDLLGFPESLDLHPGWIDFRLLRDMAAFRSYARDYAARVARTVEGRPGCRAWVFDDQWMPQFTSVALGGFDESMGRSARIDAPDGFGFTQIVGFEPLRGVPGRTRPGKSPPPR